MASTSTREESFTSLASLPPQDYDVFLSFRGEDTRKNFTDHLHDALVRHGFSTFIDDRLQRGGEIEFELLKAIERSRISIIVFSKEYAASRWCLDELVKILECKTNFKQIVVPVFYDVDPSDVRAQRGSLAEAFAKHKERYKGGGMESKVERWRAALTKAANLSGRHLRNEANGHESKLIKKIVEDISNKLNIPYLNVANYPVGIEYRVRHVNKLLSMGSDDVRMVGIWGIGGIGKTTIAKAIYNLIRHKFEGSSFLANVREFSKQPKGLVGLQEQLLSDILMNERRNIRNVDQGIEVIKQRLWRRRPVLVVLDDVDEFKQIKALAIRRDWLHSGSRIIVTTRDQSFLRLLEVDGEYMPELLNDNESFQLFSWHAFTNDRPKEDYVELSREVVGYAEGLPLVLEVWGSLFKGTSMTQWKSTLERFKKIPPNEIQEKLRISYDSLDDEEKNLFLDIACFFVGMDTNCTIKILKDCGLLSEFGLGVLSRRCLIIIYGDWLMMHDMIRDMGREIVRRECPKEPGKRSRLWSHEDVLDVLTNHMGTNAVEGLVLNSPKSKNVQVNAQAFAKMNRLRLIQLNYVHVSGSYDHLSKGLSLLCWFGFPLKSIPPNLFMEKVVAIDIPYSSLKLVWKGMKILSKLKFLNLSHSYYLTETPDFSGVTSLETLLLNDCIRLVKVHQSIECLDKLVVLEMSNCKNLWKLPLGIWKLASLQNLSLFGCSKLEKLPGFEGAPSKSQYSLFSSWASPMRNLDSISSSPTSIQGLISIRELNLENCNFSCVPDEIGSLISLERLNLKGNKNLRELPRGIWKLTFLQYLSLSGCSKLEKLPEFKGSPSKSQFSLDSSRASPVRNPDSNSLSPTSTQGLISLIELDMKECNLSYVPDEIGSLISLKVLNLRENKNLRELPLSIWKLTSLQSLSLSGCSKLKKILGFKGSPSKSRSQASPVRNSDSINLSPACTQGLISLTSLFMDGCNLSYVPDELESSISLAWLDLRGNKNLRELPLGIWKLTSLGSLYLSGCSKLEKILGFEGSPSKSRSHASPVRNPDSNSRSPASTQGLISLRELHMEYCNLSYVPNELGSSISLTRLKLTGNNLSYVPDELGSLISLTHLELGGNNFCTLPASISRLSRLWLLDVSYCTRLQSLPELPVNLAGVAARNCISLERISIRISIGSSPIEFPFWSFSCCHKLVENNIASVFRKSLLPNQANQANQEQSVVRGFSIIFPGDEVPDYFHYQSVGSVLSFVVSLLPDRKIRGWTLCVVIAGCIDQMVDDYQGGFICWPLAYEVKNKTKGFKTGHGLMGFDLPPFHHDQLWLHHVPQPRKELQVEDGDEVEYSVFRCPIYETGEFHVKKCGVNLIYEDDEKDQALIQAVADNKIVRHSYESVTTATSPAAATGTSGKTKSDDGDKSGGRKWKIPNVLPLFDDVATEVDDNDTSEDGNNSGR